MTLPIYLMNKFLNSLIICSGISYSIFFIFSLIGNLGEKFSFESILYLSALNSFQIFTYIPSHLYILSFCLLIINLNSKSELIIIKEYVKLKSLFLIITPILTMFVFVEINKNNFSSNIERIKSNLISSENLGTTKILISSEGNKKKYTILTGYNKDGTVNQYLDFEIQNQNINRGEISTNLYLLNSNLYSDNSTIYENDNFRYENSKKILFENLKSFWLENKRTIIKNKNNILQSNYNMIQSILFYSLFYFCISMIFLSKKLVIRSINSIKIFFIVLSIFLYYLLVPKIILNNFHHFFQIISIMIFLLTFFKIKHYE